jgi:hypothetical protein
VTEGTISNRRITFTLRSPVVLLSHLFEYERDEAFHLLRAQRPHPFRDHHVGHYFTDSHIHACHDSSSPRGAGALLRLLGAHLQN